jgi:hypothetical protein
MIVVRWMFLAWVLGGLSIAAARADDLREQGPQSLVVTYQVAPSARSSFREAVRGALLPRLARMHATGVLEDYHVLVSRYVDNGGWDMMTVLNFHSPADLANWRSIEAVTPAGLDPKALKLVTAAQTTPVDLFRSRAESNAAPVYLVVPYDYLVSTDEYREYVDGYVVPQMEGWIKEGAISAYGLYLARYGAGRAWSSLLVLAYRGDEGLGRRDAVTRKVRAQLGLDADWKSFADRKANVRVEKQAIIADQIASGDSAGLSVDARTR